MGLVVQEPALALQAQPGRNGSSPPEGQLELEAGAVVLVKTSARSVRLGVYTVEEAQAVKHLPAPKTAARALRG